MSTTKESMDESVGKGPILQELKCDSCKCGISESCIKKGDYVVLNLHGKLKFFGNEACFSSYTSGGSRSWIRVRKITKNFYETIEINTDAIREGH